VSADAKEERSFGEREMRVVVAQLLWSLRDPSRDSHCDWPAWRVGFLLLIYISTLDSHLYSCYKQSHICPKLDTSSADILPDMGSQGIRSCTRLAHPQRAGALSFTRSGSCIGHMLASRAAQRLTRINFSPHLSVRYREKARKRYRPAAPTSTHNPAQHHQSDLRDNV
jgi:hypothetical protein